MKHEIVRDAKYWDSTTQDMLRCYAWSEEEEATLKAEGMMAIIEKFASMEDDLFDKLVEAYDRWIEDKRHRQIWKLLDLAGVTEPELDIYLTW